MTTAAALGLGDGDAERPQRRDQVVDHDLRAARAAPGEGDVEDDLQALRTARATSVAWRRVDRAVAEVRRSERAVQRAVGEEAQVAAHRVEVRVEAQRGDCDAAQERMRRRRQQQPAGRAAARGAPRTAARAGRRRARSPRCTRRGRPSRWERRPARHRASRGPGRRRSHSAPARGSGRSPCRGRARPRPAAARHAAARSATPIATARAPCEPMSGAKTARRRRHPLSRQPD